jgi:hypothetical protein
VLGPILPKKFHISPAQSIAAALVDSVVTGLPGCHFRFRREIVVKNRRARFCGDRAGADALVVRLRVVAVRAERARFLRIRWLASLFRRGLYDNGPLTAVVNHYVTLDLLPSLSKPRAETDAPSSRIRGMLS